MNPQIIIEMVRSYRYDIRRLILMLEEKQISPREYGYRYEMYSQFLQYWEELAERKGIQL